MSQRCVCPPGSPQSPPAQPLPWVLLAPQQRSPSEVPHCAAVWIPQTDSSPHGELCKASDKVTLSSSGPALASSAPAQTPACALSLCCENRRPQATGLLLVTRKPAPSLHGRLKNSNSSNDDDQKLFVPGTRRKAYEAEKVFVGGQNSGRSLLPADLPRLPLRASVI